jgi:reactive chlorine resistance protein C
VERAGRAIALMGVALPLLLLGHSKFAAFEVEALKPLIGSTPWLAWMYAVSSPVGVSRFLGAIEIATALLLLASPWLPRAGVAGGALAALTFCVTVSILAALPIWDTGGGGWPALNGLGQFLIKDVALLGISLVVLGESAGRLDGHTRDRRR